MIDLDETQAIATNEAFKKSLRDEPIRERPTDPATFRPSLNTQTAKSENELLLERKLKVAMRSLEIVWAGHTEQARKTVCMNAIKEIEEMK